MAHLIRTLQFSTLYPNSERPELGIFFETRLREILRTGEVHTKLLAQVPWFPLPAHVRTTAQAWAPRLHARSATASTVCTRATWLFWLHVRGETSGRAELRRPLGSPADDREFVT